jgi:hypothetical protein
MPLAMRQIEKALDSPVPSFSARARQIVMGIRQKSKVQAKPAGKIIL